MLCLVTSVTSQFEPPKCSNLCGINPKKAKFQRPENPYVSNSSRAVVDTSGECVRDADIASWTVSSRRFLSLMGMNDASFGCARQNVVERGPNGTEVLRSLDFYLYAPGFTNLNASLFRMSNDDHFDDPDNVPASCHIKVDRGVLNKTANGQFAVSWIVAYTDGGLSGWLFGLLDETRIQYRLIRAPSSVNDGCKGNKCKRYNALWFVSNTTTRYSPGNSKLEDVNIFTMFADWDSTSIPGMSVMVEKLKGTVSKLENVDNDLSVSNLAILCLPILMSIPPVSLLTSVSGRVTIWYVFATDLLAVLPLLIKGFELINLYAKGKVNLYSTLSMNGNQYGVFERWHLRCKPKDVKTDRMGRMIVVVAVWFIIASTYTEFVFWRRAKYNKTKRNQGIDGYGVDEAENWDVLHDADDGNDGTDGNQKKRRYSVIRYGAAFFLFLLFVCLTALPFIASATMWFSLRFPYIGFVSIPILFINCGGAVITVVLRAVVRRRVRQILGWRYIAGVGLGFITGPLFILVHKLKSVRESKTLEDTVDGGCVGFSMLLMVLYEFFLRRLITMQRLVGMRVFVWVYGISLGVIYIVRNGREDRILWWCFGQGIGAGVVFGPLGMFFRRFVPEIKENGQMRRRFNMGLISGMLLLVTVIPLIVIELMALLFRFT